MSSLPDSDSYHRYHIDVKTAPNITLHPHRFKVKINRWNLTKYLLKDLVHSRGNWQLFLSRPCVYGVFSGPVGGFMPRERLCVGCLRCTTQHPDIATILHNPDRRLLGDDYFTPDHIDTVVYEAETGRVPIKGAGYRGPFGGTEWDGLWTDMSEIVRPTRDGIHGREMISTVVDIGRKQAYLDLSQPLPPAAPTIPLPILFDYAPSNFPANIAPILSSVAKALQTFCVVPIESIVAHNLSGSHIIPLITNAEELDQLTFSPLLLELSDWNERLYQKAKSMFPVTEIILRNQFDVDVLLSAYRAGVRVFHVTANAHGRGTDNRFIMDLIRDVHLAFVHEGVRDEITLIGTGGIIAAEHVAKAILCGVNAVALDTPLWVALQAIFTKDGFSLPANLPPEWAQQRLMNLAGSWRDQLLEILGAMGIRELRRACGEMGRVMKQTDLERDAFSGISGYA